MILVKSKIHYAEPEIGAVAFRARRIIFKEEGESQMFHSFVSNWPVSAK